MSKETIKDISAMNAKGHVKLELYNEQGDVIFTKEKHNLVVLDANKIIANMLAQPSRKSRIADKVVTDTKFNDEGQAAIIVAKHREEDVTVSINAGTTAKTEIKIDTAPYITKLLSITIDGATAEIGKRAYIQDGPKGIVGFDGLGATGTVIIKYRKIVNDMIDMVRGSEKVSIAGEAWKRSNTPKDTDRTYAVNYETGNIVFENPKANVTVEYAYEMQYSLGFMGIGGRPANHPLGQPVSFSRNEKYRTNLDNEYKGSRQPINFPLTIEEGKPEIDVLLAKNISSLSRTMQRIEVINTPVDSGQGDGTTVDSYTYEYMLDVQTVDGARPLLEITRAKIISGALIDRDLLANNEVTIVDATTGKIRIAATLPLAGLAAGDKIEFDYKLKAGSSHLIYELNYSPVVELKAVRFENNLGAVTEIPVDAGTKGMDFGANGQVRVLNANAGTIEFKPSFEAKLAENPGKITVEYFVNSGTVVNFIADFPKGVPGPVALTGLEFIPDTSAGLIEYTAPHLLKSITEVLVNGDAITQYAVNGQKITINDPTFTAGDVLVVKYDTDATTHEIYTVAMFDQMDDTLSKMFNISGIGPITKDKNTGMRITWAVTF